MKKVVLCLLFLSIFTVTHSQQKILVNFRIEDASKNDVDVTTRFFNDQRYLTIYTPNDSKVCMSIYSPIVNKKMQVAGQLVINKDKTTLPKTETTDPTDIYSFRWKYEDNYDGEFGSGWATVTLLKIYKSEGVVYMVFIDTVRLDRYLLVGHMRKDESDK